MLAKARRAVGFLSAGACGVFAIGLGSLFMIGFPQGDDAASAGAFSPFPRFTLPSLYPERGKTMLTHRDIDPRPVAVVNIFASWCGPCRMEHSFLEQIHQQGIRVFGINYRDDVRRARSYLGLNGNPYHEVAVDQSGLLDGKLVLSGIPETFILNRDGEVIYHHHGRITEDIMRTELLPRLRRNQ